MGYMLLYEVKIQTCVSQLWQLWLDVYFLYWDIHIWHSDPPDIKASIICCCWCISSLICFCRACLEVWLLHETVGWSLKVLSFLHMQRYALSCSLSSNIYYLMTVFLLLELLLFGCDHFITVLYICFSMWCLAVVYGSFYTSWPIQWKHRFLAERLRNW